LLFGWPARVQPIVAVRFDLDLGRVGVLRERGVDLMTFVAPSDRTFLLGLHAQHLSLSSGARASYHDLCGGADEATDHSPAEGHKCDSRSVSE